MCSEWVKNIAVSQLKEYDEQFDSSQCFNVFIAMLF